MTVEGTDWLGSLRQLGIDQVIVLDFEFGNTQGEKPVPRCMVAKFLPSNGIVRQWLDSESKPEPLEAGPNTLWVAYYASAEIGCAIALGWPQPIHLLDLYVEFRNATNGLELPCGAGLLGAAAYFGLPCIDATDKDAMRTLALRGGPYSIEEQQSLLCYCESDVLTTLRLLQAMGSRIDWPRALFRGAYMAAAAQIESCGVPIDVDAHDILMSNWDAIQSDLISEVDKQYGVFDGHTFKAESFKRYLSVNNIQWPLTPKNNLMLDANTFSDMSQAHPQLVPLKQLRQSLGKLRKARLAIGQDGRNRTILSAFRSITGRNQPKSSESIFGRPSWERGLIKPQIGSALIIADYEQQEWGIAAALSGDEAMINAYTTGDPYLAFAIQAGAAPSGATKETHGLVRDQFKACALAVQYGMGAQQFAYRIGQSVGRAKFLLKMHRDLYRTFWEWSDAAVNFASLNLRIHTTLGWRYHVGPNTKRQTLMNFPMQANGAEIMRLACINGVRSGLRICMPIHDAFLVEATIADRNEMVELTNAVMADASAQILGGFVLRTEVKVIEYPNRYVDKRGSQMWETVWKIIGRGEQCAGATG